LAGMNPRLIYAEVTAYGEDDPRVGYDAVIQAETGFASMNGTDASGPLKMPVALMDLLAGHQLKEGILAALLERERTGRGRRVAVSLYEAGVTALANQAANYLMTGVVPARLGSAHPNIVPYGSSYRCRDGGFVVLAVGTDRQFVRLAECLGAAELAEDPRFETNGLRVRNRGELEAMLSARVLQFDRDTLVGRLRKADVPAGAVRNVREALLDPLAARLVLTDDCGASAMRTMAFSAGDDRLRSLGVPPALSAHAYSVLTDLLGYCDDHVRRLADAGTVLVEGQRGPE